MKAQAQAILDIANRINAITRERATLAQEQKELMAQLDALVPDQLKAPGPAATPPPAPSPPAAAAKQRKMPQIISEQRVELEPQARLDAMMGQGE